MCSSSRETQKPKKHVKFFNFLEKTLENCYAKKKKKYCVFPVSRPTLIFGADPKLFFDIFDIC
jgi:hypothetical protein